MQLPGRTVRGPARSEPGGEETRWPHRFPPTPRHLAIHAVRSSFARRGEAASTAWRSRKRRVSGAGNRIPGCLPTGGRADGP
ncbi:hypothetical protein BJ973_003120 [Actinoplanes tereljensis]